MGNLIYGVDPNSKLTPLEVRDALINCFYQAHCFDSGADIVKDKEVANLYCTDVVRKAFTDSGGDFENQTKESILKAIGWLKEFSLSFRDPKIIERHASEIMELINKLK